MFQNEDPWGRSQKQRSQEKDRKRGVDIGLEIRLPLVVACEFLTGKQGRPVQVCLHALVGGYPNPRESSAGQMSDAI